MDKMKNRVSDGILDIEIALNKLKHIAEGALEVFNAPLGKELCAIKSAIAIAVEDISAAVTEYIYREFTASQEAAIGVIPKLLTQEKSHEVPD